MMINENILNSGLFNPKFYTERYEIDSNIDPLEHYMEIGWRLCYDPSDKFSTSGYLFYNNDILKKDINPLAHYITTGINEKRKFIPTNNLILVTDIFNPYYYMFFNLNGESNLSEVDAANHYLTIGWKNIININFENNLENYLLNLPENLQECIPVLHYLIYFSTNLTTHLDLQEKNHIETIKNSSYFDINYYKNTYKLGNKINIEKHFYKFGNKRFYDPSNKFSTSGYYYKNKDVYEYGLNALCHFELWGKDEGRSWLCTADILKKSALFDVKYYCAHYLYEYISENEYEKWAIEDFIKNGHSKIRITHKNFENFLDKNFFQLFFKFILGSKKDKLFNSEIQRNWELDLIGNSELFDEKWYRDTYRLAKEDNAVLHYYNFARELLCDPSPNFCTEDYLDMYGDYFPANMNPLAHYESTGRNEKYRVMDPVHETIQKSELFDPDWYSWHFMDSDIYRNPITHYIKEGAFKGNPPSSEFSSIRYLINSRDVWDNQLNPLYHYLKHGLKTKTPYTKFTLNKKNKQYEKAVQDRNIERDYDPELENLILFLLPSTDSICGGVLSINSIATVTNELINSLDCLEGYEILLSTFPGNNTFSKYTKFECKYNVYRFDMLMEYFTSIKNLIIHIPDIFVGDFLCQISPEEIAWLHGLENLKINILNQNNNYMTRPLYAGFLHALTDDVTITCGHARYCTPNLRSIYNMPVHMLSTSNLVKYQYRTFGEKENLLLYSPDEANMKPAILEKLKQAFPDLKMKQIQNLSYDEYLNLIPKAKWMITFGEGLDGYAMESIRCGAISFAVLNHTFFNENFTGFPNFYDSYQDMFDNIVEDIQQLDSNPEEFAALNKKLREADAREKDDDRYINNIKNYYLGNYTYPIKEIMLEREDRLKSRPLVSIVMATYNGEQYLPKQLQSLCDLTYDNVEVIISDDGSTDATLSIINDFANKLNISLYHNTGTHGVAANFENGFRHVNGDYVAMCDQDDIWLPDHIEKLLYQIDEFDIIHGRLSVIDEKDQYHPSSIMHTEYEKSRSKFLSLEDFLATNPLLGCASLIKTSALKACMPFPQEIPFHDWWIVIKCIMDGNGVTYTDELVTKYRQHGNNAAHLEYKSGNSISKQRDFMRFIKNNFAEKLTKRQLDLIERVENWCFMYMQFKQYAPKGVDAFMREHYFDFSNGMMKNIVNKCQ